eukprot:TRINITY_DN1886_c0_g1_i4.p1 TRINITY_DN1886_c0_g1~~TRINITY_DN1886_c0_g1_i4.p1  ORF type:complete len:612 (-),score=64.26 TRINITY_DN1886_c0_g1_i4:52-1887(-)
MVKAAILLNEFWSEGIEEAWKSYSVDKNIPQTIHILKNLYERTKNQCDSQNEIAFHSMFDNALILSECWLRQFEITKDETCLNQAFDLYYSMYRRISEQIKELKIVHLENVSPKLYQLKNCDISIPGVYNVQKRGIIRIAGFHAQLEALPSKQKPRKIKIYGTDGKEYVFLLKGHEDMRQDERVMQLFSLINKLLNNNEETQKKELGLISYAVVPLSTNTGIVGWVQNSNPLQQLIKYYRQTANVIQNSELRLMHSVCQPFDVLPVINKAEIFRYIMENSKGQDLEKVLWMKSPNSEIWLERRTTYTRSLATMSMVGYILGLGDRHPSNIMLKNDNFHVVHIDFGDCWEVAMKREKFPERVPFRATRMLIKAMEGCGVEGTFRSTCQTVMTVLRDNRESVLTVLEAFVHDPLLHWRLFTEEDLKKGDAVFVQKQQQQQNYEVDKEPSAAGQSILRGMTLVRTLVETNSLRKKSKKKREDEQLMEEDNDNELPSIQKQNHRQQHDIINKEKPSMSQQEDEEHFDLQVQSRDYEAGSKEIKAFLEEDRKQHIETEILNKKAVDVLNRIKKKLIGRDFKENEALGVNDQVNKLILQATSHENICQAYIGWCPFW